MTDASSDASSGRSPRRPAVGRNAIGPVLGLLLLVNLAMSLYQLPLNRVIERRLCRDYYASTDPGVIGPDGSVDEKLCKIDLVQKGLGWIQGVMETIWIGGGESNFFMTIPLGFLAERWGRRLVLRLNLVSRIFMLSWAIMVGYFDWAMPMKAIIVGPTLSVLGGECVFNSITYALASDLTDDHVLRATYFGYMSSISYVVALLGPALASATMSVLLWLPFWLGIALLLLAVPMIHMLPEPSPLTGDVSDEEQRAPLLSSPIIKAQDAQTSLLRSTAERFKTLQTIVTSHPRNFSLLLISFFLTSLASSDTKLLVQYISKRYNWTFAAAGYLLSGKAVVNFTLLTVVIPKFLQTRRVSRGSVSTIESGDAANVRYANACLVVSVVGALSIAVAAKIWLLVPSLLVYALGSALPIFTLSLLKSPAVSPPHGKDHGDAANPETHIFSIVMLVKTVGSLVGAPTMAMLWVRGIGLGGLALGMPYFVSGACYMVAVGVFRGIQVDSDLPTQVRSSSSPRTRTSS